MDTTAILAELLIIGAEFVALLALVASALLGISVPMHAPSAELLVLAVIIIYPLGIVWSRACDFLVGRFDRHLKRQYFDSKDDYHNALINVLSSSGTLADGLAQIRSQFRIARATGLTSLLSAPLVLVVYARGLLGSISRLEGWAIATFAFALGLGSLGTWYGLRAHYLSWIRDASRIHAGRD